MPNWCENSLVLTHKDPEMLKMAINGWNQNKFLGTLIPEPDYTTTKVRHAHPCLSNDGGEYADAEDAWWHWRNLNWGTKWEIDNDSSEEDVAADCLEVYFLSAWAPPVEAYQEMTKQGYEIYALYFEPGCQFCGVYSSDSKDHCINIVEFTHAWVRENVPEAIIDAFDILGLVDIFNEYNSEAIAKAAN